VEQGRGNSKENGDHGIIHGCNSGVTCNQATNKYTLSGSGCRPDANEQADAEVLHLLDNQTTAHPIAHAYSVNLDLDPALDPTLDYSVMFQLESNVTEYMEWKSYSYVNKVGHIFFDAFEFVGDYLPSEGEFWDVPPCVSEDDISEGYEDEEEYEDEEKSEDEPGVRAT
jgi:hypothetical protein